MDNVYKRVFEPKFLKKIKQQAKLEEEKEDANGLFENLLSLQSLEENEEDDDDYDYQNAVEGSDIEEHLEELFQYNEVEQQSVLCGSEDAVATATQLSKSEFRESYQQAALYGTEQDAMVAAKALSISLDARQRREKEQVLQIAQNSFGRVENPDILSEGECGFDAFLDQIGRTDYGPRDRAVQLIIPLFRNHLQLRLACVDYLQKHQEAMIDFEVLQSLYPKIQNLDQYFELMTGILLLISCVLTL
jgi:hypothetical protein